MLSYGKLWKVWKVMESNCKKIYIWWIIKPDNQKNMNLILIGFRITF